MKPYAQLDSPRAVRYELRFPSLIEGRRGFAFPCDAAGQVNFNGLSERCRNDYFYARRAIGRVFSAPSVAPVE